MEENLARSASTRWLEGQINTHGNLVRYLLVGVNHLSYLSYCRDRNRGWVG